MYRNFLLKRKIAGLKLLKSTNYTGKSVNILTRKSCVVSNSKVQYYVKCNSEKDNSLYIQQQFKVTFQLYHQVIGADLPLLYGNPNLPQVLLPYGDPVDVIITAVKIGNRVTLQIPGISLTIPDNGGPSFVITSSNFVPKKFRSTAVGRISFAISSHLTDNPPFGDFPATGDYEGYVYRTGIIQINLPGGYPIPPGQFITESATVTYITSPVAPLLDNFIIATWGPSNSQLVHINTFTLFWTPNSNQDFLEYNGLDFQHGRLMTSWGDNSQTPVLNSSTEFSKAMQLAFSRIDFKDKECKLKGKTIISPEYLRLNLTEFQAEPSLAINPYNPNLVATVSSNYKPDIFINPPFNPGMIYAFSNDGGKTFDVSILAAEGSNIPGAIGADAICGWDRFNNFWLYYLRADPDNIFPLTAALVASPGGDPNKFRLIQNVTAVDPNAIPFGLDYPWLAVGPDNNQTGALDGKRPEAVWYAISQFTDQFNTQSSGANLLVYGLRINGPLPDDPNAPLTGIIGTPQQYLLEAGKVGWYGGVAVGPKGDVLITCQSTENGVLFDSASGLNETLFSIYNPQGLNGQFSTRRDIGVINMGWLESAGPQPVRLTSPWPRVVADRSTSPFNGRFYVSYIDQKAKHSGDSIFTPSDGHVVMLTWSDNGGVTWADPIQINNDPKNPNSHFMSSIALDQSTGNVVIAWYDARLDPGNGKCDDQDNLRNTDVRWSGCIVTVDYIKEVEKQRNTRSIKLC